MASNEFGSLEDWNKKRNRKTSKFERSELSRHAFPSNGHSRCSALLQLGAPISKSTTKSGYMMSPFSPVYDFLVLLSEGSFQAAMKIVLEQSSLCERDRGARTMKSVERF